MRPDEWPHQFVKDGPEQVETKVSDGIPYYIKHVKMRCVHCKARYVLGSEPEPTGACWGRNDKREMSRLGV